jgi:hypothetical protein
VFEEIALGLLRERWELIRTSSVDLVSLERGGRSDDCAGSRTPHAWAGFRGHYYSIIAGN